MAWRQQQPAVALERGVDSARAHRAAPRGTAALAAGTARRAAQAGALFAARAQGPAQARGQAEAARDLGLRWRRLLVAGRQRLRLPGAVALVRVVGALALVLLGAFVLGAVARQQLLVETVLLRALVFGAVARQQQLLVEAVLLGAVALVVVLVEQVEQLVVLLVVEQALLFELGQRQATRSLTDRGPEPAGQFLDMAGSGFPPGTR